MTKDASVKRTGSSGRMIPQSFWQSYGMSKAVFRQSLVAALPAALVALLVTFFFIDKAFTIDDSTFLFMAQHMRTDPLHPSAFEYVFHGTPGRASEGVAGPVMPLLLVPAVLSGGSEWVAHLVMLLVFAVGLVATAALALRLG